MSGRKKKKSAIASAPPAAEPNAVRAEFKVAETKSAERRAEAKSLDGKAPRAKKPEAKPEAKSTPLQRRRKRAATALEDRIGYRFADAAMLESALTHISALKGGNRANSYQRLEFLGDHVLGLVISDMLYRAYPKADEGELSRRLADLVRKETCYEIAFAIELGAALRVGSSEANSGARSRVAILADVCEALIGAVYLDGGYKAAEGLVERLWAVRLKATAPPLRDPKTVLQEWAQARGLPTPAYREIERSGPDHNPEFRVAVHLPALPPAEGVGPSKRAAEQAAAAAMLAREGVRSVARRNG
ncbi:MAG TPA: ribonuclease III [Xanthobacteraceae bacterium]|jgi:ribonuclease-3|nr:ribonuclease III [Xanthobacteraceae bacterium]